MDEYKSTFIDFLLEKGALKVGGDFKLKSGRLSPYFINVGDFNDGEGSTKLGEFYAKALLESGIEFDHLFGIPEKGVSLSVETVMSLSSIGVNKHWLFTRKVEKTHGESSQAGPQESLEAVQKRKIVGRIPKPGDKIMFIDDVFTTGDAKYQAVKELDALLIDPVYTGLIIAVNRQEVDAKGRNAILNFTKDTKVQVVSGITAMDIYLHLSSKVGSSYAIDANRLRLYLRVFGIEEVQKTLRPPILNIIESDRSVIPACDVSSIEQFEALVKETASVNGIGGYKIGFELGLGHSLPKVVEVARKYTTKPLIYDHQKAGTDIPDTGKNFARLCKSAGLDAVILFPQAGPETERSWIYHALDQGLKVIVGGRMTHPAYAQSEGGFVSDEGAMEMYRIAARAGVNHFVVPGNKPDVISSVRTAVEECGVEPVFYAPGFVAQGGKIEDTTKVAGDRWHAIVGRGIYEAKDMRKAAMDHTSKL